MWLLMWLEMDITKMQKKVDEVFGSKTNLSLPLCCPIQLLMRQKMRGKELDMRRDWYPENVAKASEKYSAA